MRILLVEGNAVDAGLLLQAITHGGFDVTSVRVETAEQMRAELARAEWDIIVADYHLPTFDGMAALKLLRSTGKAIPFIVVSGIISDETAIEVVKAGARDYIRKDQPARLVAAIRRELDAARIQRAQPRSGAPHMWRHIGIASRLMCGFVVATLLFALLGIWHAVVHMRAVNHAVIADAEQSARYLSVSVAKLDEKAGRPDVFFDQPAYIQELVEKLARVQKRDIEIVDSRKRIVADVITQDIGMTYTHDEGNDVALTIQDGRARAFVERSADYPAGIRQMVVPIQARDGKIVGALLLDYTASYESDMRHVAVQTRWFAIAGLFVLAIAAGIGWVTSRSITKPIHQLREAAYRLGRQELDAPISMECADEIGELADAFEQMRVNLVIALDARANLEQTLAGSNRALRRLVNRAPIAGMVLDFNGVVRMWSLDAERLYGWGEGEVLNRPAPGIPPDKRDEFEALCKRLAGGEIITGHETMRLKKDGTPLDVTLSLAPWSDSRGNVTGFISIAIDNTDRKRAEVALREANAAITVTMRELERRTAELHLLREMTDLIQGSISADEAYDVAQRYLPRLFPHDTGALYVRSPSRDLLEQTSAWGDPTAYLSSAFASEDCWALRRGQPHCVRASRDEPLCRHTPPAKRREWMCVPLLAHGEALGILHLCRCEVDDTDLAEPAFLTLAETVANSLSLSLGNLRLRETLRQQSIRDSLTGLFNRRYLDETLPREILRATRAGSTLGVVMLDIDHFKQLNDTHGHDAGDAVLSALGRFLRHHVRGDDIACRYGGEEFTLILPGASLDIVRERAEQVRLGAQSLVVRVAGIQLGTITLSLGVAVWPQHGETADAVLQAADSALYRAKQGGRNRVEIAA
ncbi:MAG: diguanylate cyclase [candidate division NC10 bacterium]|nr:diguanylate cyclase [candidate division NC10 bacterium]